MGWVGGQHLHAALSTSSVGHLRRAGLPLYPAAAYLLGATSVRAVRTVTSLVSGSSKETSC